jgi:patatin-like phospholipase/acyl hydrolase
MDEKIHLFRSYFNPTHPSARALDDLTINLGHQVLETPIWKIARATSAAPLYFRSIQVDGLRLIDGGILANNPSQLARAEVNSMHQNHPSGTYDPVGGTPEGRIRFLVSLGTGMQASQTIRGAGLAKVVSIFRRALNEMTNPEPVNDELQRALGALNPSAYYRFNVERHLRNMKLDECIMRGGVNLTFSKIERAVTEYFNDGDVLDRSRKLARQLVEHRR